MMALTEPKAAVPIGLLFSLLLGVVMPVFGIILSRLLFDLQAKLHDETYIREKANFWCLMMLMCAVASGTFIFMQKMTFRRLGEGVTQKMRRILYTSMLEKHMGWFDQKENAPGQLSTVLASDAQTINGVSAEGLASQMEAACALLSGVAIGFILCW